MILRSIQRIIASMTLEEKASLCSGQDFWHTKPVERLGIPSILMTDGPHGLRKQCESSDHLGLNSSVPATCFPTAAATACSWDRDLMRRIGAALGEECQAEDVSILLGPGANIKRSPLCGRNFEYFSEDPYLSSEMAAGHIKGVQSQGVGTSLKHYAANNQEHLRMTINAVADERTLREIYLSSFEGAVRQAEPWTVMCAYNQLNGTYCSENDFLLKRVLKEEWGFEGFVVSDWGAVNDRVDALSAGMDLEMPSTGGESDRRIVEAVQNGALPESVLDQSVERLLKIIFKAVENKKPHAVCDMQAHHKLARDAARESMVLLKNEDGILPLKTEGTMAVLGGFARKPRYQGGGSSHSNPIKVDDAVLEIGTIAGDRMKILYAQGYRDDPGGGIFGSQEFISCSDVADQALIAEAVKIAQDADVAVVFAGLPDSYESEGYDRKHLGIPEGQRMLIEAVSEVQKNIVVVLSNGSPIEMPWLDKVKGVLEAYLGGQAFGGAAADVLFGLANPSGKLSETFPFQLSDTPSFLNFPGEKEQVEYREGLFVGYRYYDARQLKPLFPFGFGLSYTTFEYSGLVLDKAIMDDSQILHVEVTVKNTGKIAGKEIVQLYVSDRECCVLRPKKELKGFEKVALSPGEAKKVCFILDKRAFAYYHTGLKDWYVESGEFGIHIGKSSADIVLEGSVTVRSTTGIKKRFTRNTTIGEVMASRETAALMEEALKGVMRNLGLNEEGHSLLASLPLRNLISFNHTAFTEKMLEELLTKMNNGCEKGPEIPG